MPIASDIYRAVSYKVESAYGTVPGASGAQALRRVGSTLDLTKETYQSGEIRQDFQVADYRHGVRRVTGSISGELSAKTYADFFGALLKRDFAAFTALTGLTITITGAGPTYTVARSAGDWLAGGVKIGDVVRLTAGSFNALNLNKNLWVTAVTALNLTVVTLNGSAMFAEGPIASATLTLPGKKTFIPQSGHTDKSFAFEHFYADLVQSEVFSGCKVTKISLSLPPTGMAEIQMDVTGKDLTTAGAQYFTSPTALTSTGVMAAVNGMLRVAGAAVSNVTGLTLDIDGAFSGAPVVGSNTVPAQTPGTVSVSGQATMFFDSTAQRDAFVAETELDLMAVFTADNTPASDFITFVMPRIKHGGAAKAPSDGGLVQTIPFMALLNVAGGSGVATEKTTLSIQDSQA
jgi:hypothetical protein